MRKRATKSRPAPAAPSGTAVAHSRFPAWLIAGSLALVTLALYWPATGNGSVNYDDNTYLWDNPHVAGGLTLENVRWAFRSTYAANWHPVTWLSHMLDCQLFGLTPMGHHLTSVLLHSLNAALVFVLLRRLTGATWRALLVAALFATHPLRVESVAWIAERKDVLSTCFGLLTLLAYARYARSRVPASQIKVQGSNLKVRGSFLRHPPPSFFFILALGFFALGLMSKPMLVTWPFILLLLDFWPLERFKPGNAWRLVAEKAPFFALAIASSIVTFHAQQQAGALVAATRLPFLARGGNALLSCCRYLGKMFWPADLAVFYPHPGHWPVEKVLLASLLLGGVSLLLFLQRRRYPFLLMGWLWYCGTLVPVIGLVQAGDQAMADRYTYIPSLGILILATWGAHELIRRRPFLVAPLSVAASALIILFLSLTRHQLEYWKDGETLFRHALDVTQNNYVAHCNLGEALARNGHLDEAIAHYQDALRIKPDYTDAHNNLGNALVKKGQIDQAIAVLQEAVRLNPNRAETHNNLGTALDTKGLIDQAIRQYHEAIRLNPLSAQVHYNLGLALDKKGQTDTAITRYQEAIHLNPAYADAHNNLGNALDRKGQPDAALHQYQEAVRLKPAGAEARFNLALALDKQGRIDEAISQYQEAVRLNPDDTDARTNLARVLRLKNDPVPR